SAAAKPTRGRTPTGSTTPARPWTDRRVRRRPGRRPGRDRGGTGHGRIAPRPSKNRQVRVNPPRSPIVTLPPLVEPAAELSTDEIRRYSRHLIIPDVGVAGQKRLKNAKVLSVGAGGLGSPTLMYLAAPGVGTLGIVDFDTLDE